MACFDICLAWNWEFDADFVRLLENAAASRGLSLLQVTPANLEQVMTDLEGGATTIRVLFDRASDSFPGFQPLQGWAERHRVFRINPFNQTRWADDKANMHHEFIRNDIATPQTIILPPYNQQVDISAENLDPLGERFVIKPACGGGGAGVIMDASNWEQVLVARQAYPGEKYLLQSMVNTRLLNGRAAWFRILVCDGAIYPCWWDPRSHVYMRVSAEEMLQFNLRGLHEIPLRISQICGLQLFSTELALTNEGRFVAVDYVNDPVDLRVQSLAGDGVPDEIVMNIASRLVRLAERHIGFVKSKPAESGRVL
jgi:hypothetical protein